VAHWKPQKLSLDSCLCLQFPAILALRISKTWQITANYLMVAKSQRKELALLGRTVNCLNSVYYNNLYTPISCREKKQTTLNYILTEKNSIQNKPARVTRLQ